MRQLVDSVIRGMGGDIGASPHSLTHRRTRHADAHTDAHVGLSDTQQSSPITTVVL